MNTNIDTSLKTFKTWVRKQSVFSNLRDPFEEPYCKFLKETNPWLHTVYLNIDRLVCLDEEEPTSKNSLSRNSDTWYKEHAIVFPLEVWQSKYVHLTMMVEKDTLTKTEFLKLLSKITN